MPRRGRPPLNAAAPVTRAARHVAACPGEVLRLTTQDVRNTIDRGCPIFTAQQLPLDTYILQALRLHVENPWARLQVRRQRSP
jgi:hypothetical protein